MKHAFIQAQDLEEGMVIIPPIRTMRHAVVEGIKARDGYGLVVNEFGKLANFRDVPRDMRNHDTSYVVVKTDIGVRSYESLAGVNVMVQDHG